MCRALGSANRDAATRAPVELAPGGFEVVRRREGVGPGLLCRVVLARAQNRRGQGGPQRRSNGGERGAQPGAPLAQLHPGRFERVALSDRVQRVRRCRRPGKVGRLEGTGVLEHPAELLRSDEQVTDRGLPDVQVDRHGPGACARGVPGPHNHLTLAADHEVERAHAEIGRHGEAAAHRIADVVGRSHDDIDDGRGELG